MQEKKTVINDSGIEISEYYTPDHPGYSSPTDLPGEFPFTRGVHADMYRGRLWGMRQYAGFSTAEESNKRFHYLLSQGVAGINVAFDLPTQNGYDSDHPLAEGEVGKAGVAIDSLVDMEALFRDIRLDEVSTSMAINPTAFILLAFYVALARKQGIDLSRLKGTIQNDILMEYAARGTHIYPPKPSMRIITDMFEWCGKELPGWNSISISGYQIREAGSTAVQEIAFTLSNAKAYVQAALGKGLDIDLFGRRLTFFFSAHNNLFEEVAKFRAARRIWARIMQKLGAKDPRAQMLRFHAQTAGSSLTAQEPLNNISRVTIQAMAAILGGTQSLNTNGYDGAMGLPTEDAARTALRAQQILAFECGMADTADPLAGSFYVETLTNKIEESAEFLIKKIDNMGGSVSAIEHEFMQEEIAISAYAYQKQVETQNKIIVGMNKFKSEEMFNLSPLRVDDSIRNIQTEKLDELKRSRDPARVDTLLQMLNDAASGDQNLMPVVLEAVENQVTLGEMADTLREVFGENR